MFGLSSLFGEKKNGITVLSPEDYFIAINKKKVQLIDVRTPLEYQAGHLKGAVNINLYDPTFSEKINRFNKEAAVFIYCQSGMRSRQAASILQKSGFTKIFDLRGGYSCWTY